MTLAHSVVMLMALAHCVVMLMTLAHCVVMLMALAHGVVGSSLWERGRWQVEGRRSCSMVECGILW